MNYNIVYIAFVGHSLGGVEQKILAQFDQLKNFNKQTFLILASNNAPGDALSNEIISRDNIKVLVASSAKSSLGRRREKFRLISNELSLHDKKNTIVYFRFPGADPLFLRFLKGNKGFRFVTEHQEIENKLRMGIFHGNIVQDIVDFLYGKAVRNIINGFVGVSTQYLEAQKSYLSEETKLNKYFLVNGNGIATQNYPLRTCSGFDGKNLHLLFVGSVYKSHGLHRIVKTLIKNSNELLERELKVFIHIAGAKESDTYLKKVSNYQSCKENFIYHGFLNSTEIDKLANDCHLAINSLGLHRIGLRVTSTLKSREYFARGIPYITSSFDDDFEISNPFIYIFPANEDAINLDELIGFVDNVMNVTEHPGIMRDYAYEKLDWKVKMKRLEDFFSKIMISANERE